MPFDFANFIASRVNLLHPIAIVSSEPVSAWTAYVLIRSGLGHLDLGLVHYAGQSLHFTLGLAGFEHQLLYL